MQDLVDISAQNVLFIIDNAVFSKEDIKWNNYTFTWLDSLHPLINTTEAQLLKEKESWIVKLKEKRIKLQSKITEYLNKSKELKQRDRISDAENICREIEVVSTNIQEFQKEVT